MLSVPLTTLGIVVSTLLVGYAAQTVYYRSNRSRFLPGRGSPRRRRAACL